jgi:hypothetical protein
MLKIIEFGLNYADNLFSDEYNLSEIKFKHLLLLDT